MGNSILNDKSLQVFIIIAETLTGWKNPTTDEGKAVLMQHYAWGAALKTKGKLILAVSGKNNGLISLNFKH